MRSVIFMFIFQPSGSHALVTRTEVPTTSGLRKPKIQALPSSRVGANNRTNHNGGISTPTPPVRTASRSSSRDDPLIEMINTTIVDRSPAVKWGDVGTSCYNSFFLIWNFGYLVVELHCFYIFSFKFVSTRCKISYNNEILLKFWFWLLGAAAPALIAH